MELRRLAQCPTWLLGRANTRSHALLTEGFAAHGVRGYHYRVLAALDEYGSLSQAEVGRRAGLDRSDVVATVDDLVAAKLVRRTADATDRRRNVIAITKRGASLLLRLDQTLSEVQDLVLAPLTARERTAFTRLLRKLT